MKGREGEEEKKGVEDKAGERKRNFDLFMASPNQLQTHWTALTLVTFCSTSSGVPLSSSHLSGIPNGAKQKLPPSHSGITKERRQFLIGGCAGGNGGGSTAFSFCFFCPFFETSFLYIQKAVVS